MSLEDLFNDPSINPRYWVLWNGERFIAQKSKPKEGNRETLARVYLACSEKHGQDVRGIWWKKGRLKPPKSLPSLIGRDPFLCRYTLDLPLRVSLLKRIWNAEPTERPNPIHIEWNPYHDQFYDVDATPPGTLAKLFIAWRLKADQEQLKMVKSDLETLVDIKDLERRKFLTLAILSHGAAYRELDGRILSLPSFVKEEEMVSFSCQRHLIAEGVKTLSLVPIHDDEAQSIYLCQGTELWPSQSSMMGSILANFATHGSATAAYAHSWRRIHKHLRDLNKPLVCGHSMGGSLAIQVGLYSHELVDQIYAFNPPMPNQRDYDFYHRLPEELQAKIHVSANLDDFAFWRIGAKLMGKITLFLGKKRWRYYPVSLWDCIFIFPAAVKFAMNVRHAFPAHQKIIALNEMFVRLELTQEEIELENQERSTRFDYLSFFPKLYDPTRTLLQFVRKIFKWQEEEEYLKSEIEVIALHERDLIDTMTEENRAEIERELEELGRQKKRLQKQLSSL